MYTRIKEVTDIDLYRQNFPKESDRLIAWFLINHYQLTKDEASDAITDGANDHGIDAVFIEDDARVVHIIQSKFTSGEKSERSDIDDLRKAYEALKDLPTLQRDGNPKIKSAVEKFGDCIRSGYTVSLEFVSTSKVSSGVKRSYTTFKNSVEADNNSFEASVELFDSPVIENIYNRASSGGNAFAVDFTFSLDKSHGFSIRERNKLTHHITLPLVYVLDIPEVRSGRVFDINPRKYLGANKINKGMEQTIRTNHWMFNDGNNGITAVCKSVVNNGDGTLTVKGMQIVNGCQTVNSIFNCSEFIKETTALASGDEGFVSLKVIEGATQDEIGFISEVSNKQSGMKHRDFISQDELIIKTKKTYERKYPNGKFVTQRGTDCKNCPPDKVIDLIEYGSCVAVWNCLKPNLTRSERSLIDGNIKLLFREGYSADQIYNLNKIMRDISDYWADIKNNTEASRTAAKVSLAERRSATKYKHMYALVLLISNLYWNGEAGYKHVLNPCAFYSNLSENIRKELIKESSNMLSRALRAYQKSEGDESIFNTDRWVRTKTCDIGIRTEIENYIDNDSDKAEFNNLVKEIKSNLNDSDFYDYWVDEDN